MKVQILDAAREDLVEGFGFYESSERGISFPFTTHPHRHLAGKWVRRAAGPYLFKPVVPAPRPLAAFAPRRFKSLSIHIHAHSATRQDLRPAGTSRSLLSKLPTMLQQFGAGRPQISLLALRGIPTILLPCC